MAVELYDEHEQSERVRNWIRENGMSIVLGLALAIGGVFGWRQWGEYQQNQSLMAADYYTLVQTELEAGRNDEALAQYQAMRESVSGQSYTALAGLLVASTLVESGEFEQAAAIYEDILDRGDLRALWPATRLRLARLRYEAGDPAAALELVSGEAPTGYEAPWNELRGDLLMAQDRIDEAREAYREALERIEADGGNPVVVRSKLDATGPGTDASPS